MARTTRSKGRTYRGFLIRLQSDDRYDVFENAVAEKEGRAICDNFKEISTAMEWIDQTQFDTQKEEPVPPALPRTVELTPTWVGTMPILIAAVRDGTDTGRRMAEEELMRMAKIMDNMNAGRPAEEGVPS